MTLASGIHALTAKQYHADPCAAPSLSFSIAKVLIDQSPLHAWFQHPRLNVAYQAKESSKFDVGSAAHLMLLERRSDGIVIVCADDWKSKAAREQRDAARAEGKFPILEHYWERITEMIGVVHGFIATTELAGIFETGAAEQTVLWQEGTVWCRCRPDLLAADKRVCLDYKSTTDASPEAFIRQIGRMSYDLQAEFYVRGLATAQWGEPTFVFLAQEVTAPYACSLVALSNAYRAVGQQKVARALALWKSCKVSGRWPGYSTQIAYGEPKPWDLTEIDEPEVTAEEEGT